MPGEPELLITYRTKIVGSEEVKSGIKSIEGSLKQARDAINYFSKTLDLRVASNVKSLQELKNHTYQMAQSIKPANTQFDQLIKVNQQASNAILNLNYVIRDSPYFMRNFGMGVMAIGNNLNPLIDSLVRANQEAKRLGVTLGSVLVKSLTGAGMLMFSMSIAVAAFQAIVFAMESSKKKTKEQTEEFKNMQEQLDQTIESLEQYKIALPGYKETEDIIKKVEDEIKALEEKIKASKELIDLYETQQYERKQFRGEVYEQENVKVTKQIQLEIQNLDNLNKKLAELNDKFVKLTLTSKERNEVTDIGNKILKGSIEVTKNFQKEQGLSNNQITALIGYLNTERNKWDANNKMYNKVGESIENLSNKKAWQIKEIEKEKSLLDQLIGTTYEEYIEKLKKIEGLLSSGNLSSYDENQLLDEKYKILGQINVEYEYYNKLRERGYQIPEIPIIPYPKKGYAPEEFIQPGSLLDLQNRLKELKIELDGLVVGTEEFNKKIIEVSNLDKYINDISKAYKGMSAETEVAVSLLSDFSTSLSRSFAQSIAYGDRLIVTLRQVVAALVEAILKALIFRAVTAILSGGTAPPMPGTPVPSSPLPGGGGGSQFAKAGLGGRWESGGKNINSYISKFQRMPKLKIELDLNGNLKTNKNDFVVEFNRAEANYNKRVKLYYD